MNKLNKMKQFAIKAKEKADSAADSAARSVAYEKYADKLLELMRDCK